VKVTKKAPPAKRGPPKAESTGPPREKERQLTLKQLAFVHAYIETGNASESYRRAYDTSGMSAASVGREAQKVLANPIVAPQIEAAREKLAKTYGIDANRIVKELARIALADIGKAVTWTGKETREETKGGKVIVRGANDVVLIGSEEMGPDTRAAISEVIQTKDGVRVKFHDKAAAIAQLARIAGLTDDTRESGNITVQILNFSTEPQAAPVLERKEVPSLERMRTLQRGGNG
jgi:phage terminase small subunit